MSLQTITNVNIDFYDKKYILINAKQYDKNSRFLSVTCYNHGEIYPINSGEHSAYVRYRKADNNAVFNFCEINRKGKIIVELTEQMLASDGICYADLVIVNNGSADVDAETGEIIAIDDASILSTMPLHIDVTGTVVDNSDIESSYEFNGLNTALEKAEAEYTEVILTAKSYAVGGTNMRENEDYDNAKYYYEQSLNNADKAKASEEKALASETNAKISETNASTSEINAKASEEKALASETSAKTSEENAKSSETNAKISEENAKISEENAFSYKEIVENINNSIMGSINTLASNGNIGSFIFIKPVTFEELISLSDDKKATGYVYCITDDFVTNDSFVNGAGLSYTAGTNVYYVIDEVGKGKWNCLGGATSPTATVDEVKDYLGI